MTLITNNDIIFTLSGGASNTNANASLGGEPSNYPIIAGRLFSDVTSAQSTSGKIDYRCVYITNNSTSATLFNAFLYTKYTVESDTTIELGFRQSNERQDLTINNYNSITGGNFSIVYKNYIGNNYLTVNWNSSATIWADNLKSAIRSISGLENVEVNFSLNGSNINFEIRFLGSAGLRSHEIIEEDSNNLVSSIETNINISRIVSGGPFNSIPDDLDVETTSPYETEFNKYESVSNSYLIGSVAPLDVIPVWIKRTIPENSMAIENDGFTLRLEGETSSDVSPTSLPTPTQTVTPTVTPTQTVTPTVTPTQTPTPTPSPTSKSTSCLFIECGGTMAYADCGLINEPGYIYSMDCDLCECVKSAN